MEPAPEPPSRVLPGARGFDRVAAVYARSRPEYSPEVIGAIRRNLGIGPGRRVLDLAAGTGKLSRALAEGSEADLVAVEPSAGMRAEFHRGLPAIPILDGTAEAIPLPQASVDAVAVGQAFHWFRVPEAAEEIARVLRPDGGLALVWNLRDERVPWVARFGEIVRRREGALAVSSRDRTGIARLGASGRFGAMRREEFRTEQRLDAKGLLERALSISYVGALGPGEEPALREEIAGLVASEPELSGGAMFRLPYVTELYWCRKA